METHSGSPDAPPNDADGPGPASPVATVLDRVGARAAQCPQAPAILDGDREATYGEAWAASARVATALRQRGVRRGDVLGLCADRSIETVLGLLGILRAGAAYVPLDLAYPAARLEHMLHQSQARRVVGSRDGDGLVSPERFLALGELLGHDAPAEPPPPPGGRDLCYVMFTSGSSGLPKGVMMEHGGLDRMISREVQQSRCGAADRTLQFAPLSFDVSFQEVFATLASGGVLVCIAERDRVDPLRLWDVLVRLHVNRLYLPFVALQAISLFAETLPGRPLALKEVITAGEQLQCNEKVRRLFELVPGCDLVNEYGPTETHAVTAHRLTGPPESWPLLPPIGAVYPGLRLHVLDDHGLPVPTGEVGELGVAGLGVARGYVGRPGLTAERFVCEPDGHPGARMYLTGDFVSTQDAQTFHYEGRKDQQIKINGVRVEVGEVESALASHPAVRDACVVAAGGDAVTRHLVAFAVPEDPRADPQEILKHLRARLPAVLAPRRLIFLERFPTTASGKRDRKALNEMAETA